MKERKRTARNIMETMYGIGLCAAIGFFASLLALYLPIGAVSIAIILGIAIGNIANPAKVFKKGVRFTEKNILSLAIALMGVNLNFFILNELGYKSILIVVFGVIITILFAVVCGKIFGFDKKLVLLLGIGSAVCGSSAIAATEQIINATEEDVGLSITIVNFLGTIGIFLLPLIGTVVLKFTNINSGVLIGNTLQAVGQVVAAGFSVSETAGQTATIVKMARILMLTPLVFILIFIFSKKSIEEVDGEKAKRHNIPLFIIGFILFSLVSSFKLLPEEHIKTISWISHHTLIIAMAGIGLKITFKDILRDGKSALAIGVLIFLMQIAFTGSMVAIYLK